MKLRNLGSTLAGLCAGAVNGMLGAGGGMVLIPLLSQLTELSDSELFPASVSIMLPICLISLMTSGHTVSLSAALPYLIGSAAGGLFAGWLGPKIPTLWLHRGLGLLILWGGIRYLW